MPNEDHRWRNIQSATYIKATQMMGLVKNQLDGTLWNYVKSKAPKRPKTNKNGKLSSKKLNTLPSVIRETIETQKLKEKDYKELIEAAEGNLDTWFIRIFTPMNSTVVDTIFSDFIDAAREIADRGLEPPKRSLGQHCEWCDYEGICRAAFTGGDPDYIKEREYVVDAKRTPEVEIEEKTEE